ncbi:copper amine oxidase N-terminal domain-containing protein [Paenibacillus sp. DR312]|uniref:copper amine oxidase N-terminal domain-containing protein n=1 Tax=unclassified Paenibacillus TaxID=185978 RepID=UPI001C9645E3|nr:copper amine oxidase N-terminal domain-containing protein [Paenibacillus sp. DR312]QZN77381.1 copper amine oxidase N-terminal domain-containing protein [Paenibacillus sp. DR312]
MKKVAHKVAYIAGGIIIGIVFSTSAGAFADTFKSVVGKKVTGEYTIVVDGKKLSDKGAVIDSRANVPARALSEALGADVSVSGKTITISSQNEESNSGTDTGTPVATSNKFIGYTKASLQELRDSKINNTIKIATEGREDLLKEMEILKQTEAQGIPVPVLADKEKQLASYDKILADANAELKLIDEALLTAK